MNTQNEKVTEIVKSVLNHKSIGYQKLYREKRVKENPRNISGKTIKFQGISINETRKIKKLKKAIRVINKRVKRYSVKVICDRCNWYSVNINVENI